MPSSQSDLPGTDTAEAMPTELRRPSASAVEEHAQPLPHGDASAAPVQSSPVVPPAAATEAATEPVQTAAAATEPSSQAPPARTLTEGATKAAVQQQGHSADAAGPISEPVQAPPQSQAVHQPGALPPIQKRKAEAAPPSPAPGQQGRQKLEAAPPSPAPVPPEVTRRRPPGSQVPPLPGGHSEAVASKPAASAAASPSASAAQADATAAAPAGPAGGLSTGTAQAALRTTPTFSELPEADASARGGPAASTQPPAAGAQPGLPKPALARAPPEEEEEGGPQARVAEAG